MSYITLLGFNGFRQFDKAATGQQAAIHEGSTESLPTSQLVSLLSAYQPKRRRSISQPEIQEEIHDQAHNASSGELEIEANLDSTPMK